MPADAPALAELLKASIETLGEDDYDSDQLEAWVAAATGLPAFAGRLQGALTLVATCDGRPAGFIALKGMDLIDMIYVHPDCAREGVGSQLLDAVEKLATARGSAKLLADASDTARPFFAAKGFQSLYRQTITMGGQWLGNTRMEKTLGSEVTASASVT